MLITITNSNSSPEVNSSEVSLKSQCEFCECTQKHPKHLLGGGAYVTFVFVHTCVYTNSSSSRICILTTNYNDHSSYKFSLVCNRSKTCADSPIWTWSKTLSLIVHWPMWSGWPLISITSRNLISLFCSTKGTKYATVSKLMLEISKLEKWWEYMWLQINWGCNMRGDEMFNRRGKDVTIS